MLARLCGLVSNGYMSASPKDTVKERLSIEEVVGTYVKLSRAGKNLRANCPFHKERTPSFYVSPERGSYYCFGCGEKGDIFTFTEKMEGIDFREALRRLAERAGVELTPYRGEAGPNRDEKERQYELHEEATKFFEENLAKHTDAREYLLKRGLKEETIRAWRLGYAHAAWREATEHFRLRGYTDKELLTSGLSIQPSAQAGAVRRDGVQGAGNESKEPYQAYGDEIQGPRNVEIRPSEHSRLYDRFRGRIIFPIADSGGRSIGFSGRFFEKMPGGKEEEPAKYLNSPETPLFRKSHVLYGFDKAKGAMRKSNFAILVEGQMDLLMMHQCGFPNALASSGTAFTADHLRLIGHTTKRLVLALDSDQAGVRSALKSAQLAYASGFDLRVAAFPEGKDPADVGKENPEELRRAVREAVTAIEFFLRRLRVSAKDEHAYRRAAQEAVLPLIAVMESNIDQAHFCEVVSQALALPQEAIRAEVLRIRSAKTAKGAPAENAVSTAPPTLPKLTLIGGLILASEDASAKERLGKLLGEARVEALRDVFEAHKERILFTLEQDDGVGHNTEDLLAELEREVLKDRIDEARRYAEECRSRGDDAGEREASSQVQELTRKLHGL